MSCLDIENKIKALDYCDFGIAFNCNYRCKMCHFWEEYNLNKDNVLPISKWKELLEQLMLIPRNESFMINISGPGETFLRKEIFEFIRYGRKLNFKMQIISNGSLIDERLAQEISDAGLELICFSLDSLNKKSHDFLRGADGARDKVLRAIENMKTFSGSTKMGINTVINKVNLNDIVELAQWVEDNRSVSHIHFQALHQPFTFFDSPDEEWFKQDKFQFLWPTDTKTINEVFEALIEFKRKGYKIVNSEKHLDALRAYFLNPLQFIRNNRCNLGKANVLIIDAPGNVSICHLTGIIGNIQDGRSLKEILSSPQANAHVKKINECKRNCHLVVSCYFEEE
ncbi:MAG: radical SAM protein [Candidatus Omnitrophica bacterium]|nr:radical SAM protein [Candidatus Omnitrophota bacterium]